VEAELIIQAEQTQADDRALVELLDEGGRYGPFYGPGYSNHLPMALCALRALGADAARLRDYGARHHAHLETRGAADAPFVTHDEWVAALGRADRYERHAAYAVERLSRDGVEGCLRRLLPTLLQDPGAALFHGMIRTAHAVRAGHEGEIAAGLALWSSRWQAPRAADRLGDGRLDANAWLQGLHDARARSADAARGALRRGGVGAVPAGIEAAIAGLRIDKDTLGELSRIAAGLYAASGDFVALHVVTGSHALLGLSAWWRCEDALPRFARAAALAWVAGGALERGETPAGDVAWPRVVAAAIGAEDEHVIKLVQASRELGERFEGDVFKQAAMRALGRSLRRDV
jgi:hypothetical protein